jgi:hypothetical protein
MTPQDIVRSEIFAHEISRRMVMANWAKPEEVKYHIETAQQAFSDLAAVLGYTVSKVDTGEEVA